ncbi:hypothetical protein EWM64_g9895, partial [Hericium alpestre]
SKLRERDVTIERLEGDRRWLAEREKEEKEEKEQERAEREEEKRNTDAELHSLRNTLLTLREEHADLQDMHSALSRNSTQTIASQKSRVSMLERQATALQEELGDIRHIAEERNHTIEQLQEHVDELSSAQADVSRQSMEEENWSVLREELQRQAHYMRSLEGTNAKLTAEVRHLRERQTSVEVLKEEKRGLEQKVKGMEELREKVAKLEAELQAARQEREEWASKAPATPSKTPVSVTQSLSELRLAHARLLEEHGVNLALLRRREAELAEANDQATQATETIERLQQNERRLQEKAARLEQTASLAEREVRFLKALNDSYASEQAANGKVDMDEAKETHVKELEGLVLEYKDTNHALQAELETLSLRPSLSSQGPRYQELKDALEQERQAKEEAEKGKPTDSEEASTTLVDKIEELEQELFELKGEIGAGRHVPPGVRILSLKENPASQWANLRQEVMDRLKGENEALIRRLKELEASGAGAAVKTEEKAHEELVPRESWEVVQKEKKELEEVVKQKEKRLLRLQQVFTAKSAEFREAIASIMGVKLAFYPNGQVRVTSQYDLNASFVFQPAPKSAQAEGGARMQLIAQGEGGPQDLPQLMRNWVEQEQCIPCFLASVTLECYDKWKRDREMGLVE